MEIYRFKDKALKDYSIVCEYWETSRAWGHRAILMYCDNEMLEYKCRYYNRTWEMYRYQSCMSGLINTYRENSLAGYLDTYKYKNNIDRFHKGEKEKVIKEFDLTDTGREIAKMLEAIKLRDFK